MSTRNEDLLNAETLTASLPSRFAVVRTLGSGANGVVLLATDQLLGRQVTIKVLRSEEMANETAQKRFIREAKMLATIDHPNIVKILASDITENGYPYHVMEYLEGDTLSEHLNGTPLPFFQFCDTMLQVCAGLECAHGAGVIHRDLKPSNIFVCNEQDGKSLVKIIDFGMSKTEDASDGNVTRTNAVLGSPTYMSPEQCKGKSTSAASDIYSLGCIMYECVTGEVPFKAETSYEVMYKHINESPPSLSANSKSKIGQSIGELIDSCLQKDPASRPTGLATICEKLSLASKSEVSNLEMFQKKKENNKLILTIIGACLLVGITCAGLMFIQQKQHKESLSAAAVVDEEIAGDQNQKLELTRKRIEKQKSRLLAAKTGDDRDQFAVRLMESYKAMYEIMKSKKEWSKVAGLNFIRQNPGHKEYIAEKERALALLKEAFSYTHLSSSRVKMRQQIMKDKSDTLIELDKARDALNVCDEALNKECGPFGRRTLEASEVLSSRAVCNVLLGNYDSALADIDEVGVIFGKVSAGKQQDIRNRKAALQKGLMLSPDWRGKILAEAALGLKVNPPKSIKDKKTAVQICYSIVYAWAARAHPEQLTSEKIIEIGEEILAEIPKDQQGNLPEEIAQLKQSLSSI